MEHYIGIDIGSTSTKCVAVDKIGNILARVVISSGAGTKADKKAIERLYDLLKCKQSDCERTIATGYGRMLYSAADDQISEITCHAKGLHYLIPEAHTIIDIGGQDLKVICIDTNGVIEQFVMNDKCAAGTGRFLEVMCRVMNIELSELGEYAEHTTQICTISNTCTVFAESEVISKLSQGYPIANIVAGVHDSVARTINGLSRRVKIREKIAITGGGGLNKGLVDALSRNLGQQVMVPDDPQIVGAFGAALMAAK